MPVECYNGPLDNNQRNGVGSCTWVNGSSYEGDWKDDLRHGNGKFKFEEEVYLGQW